MRAHQYKLIASLLDEAAAHLREMMFTPEAEKLQIRHFLPDELEGSAIMLRDEIPPETEKPLA